MKALFYVAVCVVGVLIFFIGCATSVPVTVTKPAEVNMASMRKIAVLDFSVTQQKYDLTVEDLIELAIDEFFDVHIGERAAYREIEEYATERFILGLVGTSYFHVVSGTKIRESIDLTDASSTSVQEIGKEVDAQGIITGEIYRMTAEDEEFTRTEEYSDPETDTVYEEEIPWMRRTSTLGLSYHVFNTESGALYASRSFEATLQDEAEEEDDLRDSEEMYREIIDSFIPRVTRQLAPYTVRESRKLMKDKSSDPLMENAKQYARNGVYDRALELYLEVWDGSRNPAAGYNGAIMYEVTGNIDAAVSLMKEVVDRYPEKKIVREYNRLIGVREEQKRLAEQLA
jgi:hypothetical protein